MDKEPKRMFKRVNVLGLDFYVDWLDLDNVCTRLISVKDVHGGRTFVYAGLEKDGVPVEDLLLEAVGVKKQVVKKEEVKAEAPAAQETEQPKENLDAQKAKRSNKRSKK